MTDQITILPAELDGDMIEPADAGVYPDAPPVRAAAIQRELDTFVHAMRLAKDDARRLKAISTTSRLLARFGDAAIEARDYVTEIAHDMYNLDADEVQAAMADGVRQAEVAGDRGAVSF